MAMNGPRSGGGRPPPPKEGARDVAARVIARVLADQAFAAASLDAELGQAKLGDPRDVGLATELTYGVLRTYGFLEAVGTRLSTRGKVFGEPLARAHLFAGFYTLAFLDRVPAFAAVSESVSGVRRAIGEKPSKFANALLRAFASELEQNGRPTLEQAIVASAPPWLKRRLEASLGAEETVRYLGAGPVPPPLAVAIRRGEDRDAWATRLEPNVTKVTRGAVSPRALLLEGAGDPRSLPGFEDALIVQEEGAQSIALALGVIEGRRVLDACAGRGNKTWLLAHEVGKGGTVVAADKHPQKLRALARRIVDTAKIEAHAVDWTVGRGEVDGQFDAVLVDAPCSGTGTLRKRPEIVLHRDDAGLDALAIEQATILRAAAACAKTNGHVVYAVCSVLREEAEDVVRSVIDRGLEDGRRIELVPFASGILGARFSERAELRLLPQTDGTDGYYIANLAVRQ